MYSEWSDRLLRLPGFPIRTSPDQCSVGNSPELFAATHVLHRLLAPRHPPHALSSLLTSISLTSNLCLSALGSNGNSRSRPKPLLFAAGWTRDTSTLEIEISFILRMHFSKSDQPTSVDRRILHVELIGIEPMTPGLQSRCSPS